VTDGIGIFNGKQGPARGYPARIRATTGWINLVAALNQTRKTQKLPPLTVTLPEFTTGDFNSNLQQFEKDTIRLYNGASGSDGFTNPAVLHEFRVVLSPAGPLQANSVLVVDANGNAGWEEVPVAARPNSGDPNYVNDVLNENPLCP
jgi:hypothetical protein